MKLVSGTFPAAVFLFFFILGACNAGTKQDTVSPPGDEQVVKRGEYLVSVIGCDDCHSPKKLGPQGPEPDMERRLSGYPAGRPLGRVDSQSVKNGWVLFASDLTATAGPWGVSFAANLTPDATGIGNWKEEQFIKAMREGKWKGLDNARPLLPPMPWQNFRNLSDDDLKSVFAFLKSIKPVENRVPEPVIPVNGHPPGITGR